jgi:hypothetical protein
LADVWRDGLHGGDEVSQEASVVVVARVERQPGGGSLAAGDPCAEQRGFPKAGGSRNEGQFPIQALVQPLDQAGPKDDVRPRWRSIKFGG